MFRLFLLIIAITVAFTFNCVAQTNSAISERDAVIIPVENYFKGQATGDSAYMRKAFHPDAKIMGFSDGKLTVIPIEQYYSFFKGKPADDEAKRKRTIESVEITGSAAIVKAVIDFPTVKYTDYLSLVKIDGEWKIVHRIFNPEPKSQPQKQE